MKVNSSQGPEAIRCPSCGASVPLRSLDAGTNEATRVEAEARKLMRASPGLDFGTAVRQVYNTREREADLAAEAIRAGVPQHRRDLAARLVAATDRHMRETGEADRGKALREVLRRD